MDVLPAVGLIASPPFSWRYPRSWSPIRGVLSPVLDGDGLRIHRENPCHSTTLCVTFRRMSSQTSPGLVRTMGVFSLVAYGVGDMLGSGVYALVGKVAGAMGNAVWLAFIASMVAAGLTALSYASLGSRHPKAGGAAYLAQRAFGMPFLSYVVGLAVMASGLTSMATQANAFAGYFQGLTGSSPWIVMIAFLAVLTAVNLRGMRESTWLNVVCTAIEVGGLFIVVAVGLRYWGGVDLLETPPGTSIGTAFVLNGAVLAFYSFVGFEDMLNVSEEVKDPARTFPRAVVIAVAITTVIYIAVAITAVSVVPWQQLAQSNQPLVDVVRTAAPGFPISVFSFIAMFAIANTALLNFIMGSRLAYGMARQGLLPKALGVVHPKRFTPVRAILVLAAIVLVLMFVGGVRELASATSALLLLVFMLVNAALVVLKRRPGEKPGAFEVPLAVPVLGVIVCASMVTFVAPRAMAIAAVLLLGISALYFVLRPKVPVEVD